MKDFFWRSMRLIRSIVHGGIRLKTGSFGGSGTDPHNVCGSAFSLLQIRDKPVMYSFFVTNQTTIFFFFFFWVINFLNGILYFSLCFFQAVKLNNYEAKLLLKSYGILINKNFTQGRYFLHREYFFSTILWIFILKFWKSLKMGAYFWRGFNHVADHLLLS